MRGTCRRAAVGASAVVAAVCIAALGGLPARALADTWSPTPLSAGAVARSSMAAILDTLGNRLIVWGGQGSSSTLNTVSAMDLTTHIWFDVSTTGTAPSARTDASAIWDPLRNRMLIFGGAVGTVRQNDLWALDLTTFAWSHLFPGGFTPSVRSDHVAVYDRIRDRMIVFGGTSGTASSNDLYALDLVTLTWSKLIAGGTLPEARVGAAATLDGARTHLVIMGGVGATSGDLNDVWSLDLGTLTWSAMATRGTKPAGRSQHVLTYDAARNAYWVTGGTTSGGTLFSDVWLLGAYNGQWGLVPATPDSGARARAVAVPDVMHDTVVLFGGTTASGVSADTWLLTLATQKWTLAPVAYGTPPSARTGTLVVADDAHKRFLVFGGWTQVAGSNLADLTALLYPDSANVAPRWQALTATGSIPGRHNCTGVIDTVGDQLLVFGGATNASDYTNDLWSLDLTSLVWTKLMPVNAGPAVRNGHVAVLDATGRRMVLFGGLVQTGNAVNDTWLYDIADNVWTQATGDSVPSPRSGCAAGSDDAGGGMVIAMGGNNTSVLHDTWAFNYSTLLWARLAPANPPLGWSSVGSAMDRASRRMIMFGGLNGTLSPECNAYLPANNAWATVIAPGELPAARVGHGVAYSLAQRWTMVWGGATGTSMLQSGGLLYQTPPLGVTAATPPQPASPHAAVRVTAQSRGRVAFALAASAAPRTLDIFAVDGRRVARLALDAHATTATWHATAPRGVYLARLAPGAVAKIALY